MLRKGCWVDKTAMIIALSFLIKDLTQCLAYNKGTVNFMLL